MRNTIMITLFFLIVFAGSALFADPRHDGHEEGRPFQPGGDKAGSALVITGREAGSDSILILDNSLGLYGDSVFGEGLGRTDLVLTLFRAGEYETFDLSEALKKVTDFSQPIPIGTELKAGDKIYLSDGASGGHYLTETLKKTGGGNGIGNGFNEGYGYDRYFQADFGGASYDGSLDFVFTRGPTVITHPDADPPQNFGIEGQPLPGILTTLAISGAGGLLLRRMTRRKRRDA